jgi:hypothetical protein
MMTAVGIGYWEPVRRCERKKVLVFGGQAQGQGFCKAGVGEAAQGNEIFGANRFCIC